MIINDEPIKFSFVEILYHTLRQCRPDFKSDDYRWKLGAAVIYDLDSMYHYGIALQTMLHSDEVPTLFGIKIDIDYENPYTLQLFEDITNKIYIEPENDKQ